MEKDEDGNVRSAASGALGNVAEKGDSIAIQALIKRIQEDKNEYVRRAASEALGKVAEKGGASNNNLENGW